jgi:pilus assembly protein CpaB
MDAKIEIRYRIVRAESFLSGRPVMRAKSVLLLVIALGCGVVASVAVSQVVLDQKNRGVVQTAPVLVVAKELSAATKIQPDSFKLEQWPIDRIPMGAISDPKVVENKYTKQRFYVGEPLLEAKLSGKGADFTVPVGFKIFDASVTPGSGGVGYITPGNHVDVYAFIDKGRSKDSKSVKVIENLEVVMVDGFGIVDPETTKTKQSNTIQLLVKDSQYIVLDTAANIGKLRLALRPSGQVATSDDQEDTGEKFLKWLGDNDTVAEPKPIIESAPATPVIAPAEPVAKHELVVVTPSKSIMYRFSEGKSQPQKINLDEPVVDNTPLAAPLGGYQSGSPYAPTYAPPYIPPRPQPTKPVDADADATSNSAQSTQPVDPANSAQPNLTWDPASGTWQSGGFKATYPSTK